MNGRKSEKQTLTFKAVPLILWLAILSKNSLMVLKMRIPARAQECVLINGAGRERAAYICYSS